MRLGRELLRYALEPLARWRARRRVRRDLDRRLAAWAALPPDERDAFVHPSSPQKPAGWTVEKYREMLRRRDAAQ